MSLKYSTFELMPDRGILVTREEGRTIKEKICSQLENMNEQHVLVIDLSAVDFIDASCADEIVVKVLARIEAGEFPDRFVLYRNIANQHRENIHLALIVADKFILAVGKRKGIILGKIGEGYRRAFIEIIRRKETTAKELQEVMEYKTVNEASTKLAWLYKRGYIAREPYRQPVQGGGRQFKYISLLKDYEDEDDFIDPDELLDGEGK